MNRRGGADCEEKWRIHSIGKTDLEFLLKMIEECCKDRKGGTFQSSWMGEGRSGRLERQNRLGRFLLCIMLMWKEYLSIKIQLTFKHSLSTNLIYSLIEHA